MAELNINVLYYDDNLDVLRVVGLFEIGEEIHVHVESMAKQAHINNCIRWQGRIP